MIVFPVLGDAAQAQIRNENSRSQQSNQALPAIIKHLILILLFSWGVFFLMSIRGCISLKRKEPINTIAFSSMFQKTDARHLLPNKFRPIKVKYTNLIFTCREPMRQSSSMFNFFLNLEVRLNSIQLQKHGLKFFFIFISCCRKTWFREELEWTFDG